MADWLCGPAPKPAKDGKEGREVRDDGKPSKQAEGPIRSLQPVPVLSGPPRSLSDPDAERGRELDAQEIMAAPVLSTPSTADLLQRGSLALPTHSNAPLQSTAPLDVPSPSPAPFHSSHLAPQAAVTGTALTPSPLARSPASFTSLVSCSDSSDSELDSVSAASHGNGQSFTGFGGFTPAATATTSTPLGTSAMSSPRPQPQAQPSSPRKAASKGSGGASDRPERPELVIPAETARAPGAEGSKCYLHLVKQRLMGMYLSIYVHKDCRDLVQGVDKDFVTTGLAGGRLGNKGGL